MENRFGITVLFNARQVDHIVRLKKIHETRGRFLTIKLGDGEEAELVAVENSRGDGRVRTFTDIREAVRWLAAGGPE